MARKRKIHTVMRGWLSAEGSTEKEARAKLGTMIDWACSAAGLTIERRFDCMIIVAASPTGWSYKAFPISDTQHGKQVGCYVSTGPCDYASILLSARMHAAQLAWDHDCDDEQHINAAGLTERASELRSWIRFQRSYKANKECGMTDEQAHAAACGIAA